MGAEAAGVPLWAAMEAMEDLAAGVAQGGPVSLVVLAEVAAALAEGAEPSRTGRSEADTLVWAERLEGMPRNLTAAVVPVLAGQFSTIAGPFSYKTRLSTATSQRAATATQPDLEAQPTMEQMQAQRFFRITVRLLCST